MQTIFCLLAYATANTAFYRERFASDNYNMI